MLSAALAWAARGFRVFPLAPRTKVPIKDLAWKEAATVDPLQLAAWWSENPQYNIGVSAEGLVIVDIDDKHGKPGSQNFADLALPTDTLIVRTPTGGRHVYYSGPPVGNSAGRLGLGLDIRSSGGYVVAPGSYLDGSIASNKGSEGVYEIAADASVREAPEQLLIRLGTPRSRDGAVSAIVELDAPGNVIRAIEWLEREAPLAAEGDGGDALTYRVAATLKDYGVSETIAVDLMATRWNDRCTPPWTLDELRTKVENAYLYGKTQPGAHSPAAEFAGVVVPQTPQTAVSGRVWADHGDEWSRDQSWSFYQMLPQTGVVVLNAPPSSGKTFVALELGRCLATGKPFFGVEPDELGGTVYLYAGTEGSGWSQRLAALEEDGRLPMAATRVSGLNAAGALGKLFEDLKAKDAEFRDRFGVPLRMVVLETLSASGLLKDENDNAEAALAMEALGNMSLGLGALFVTTHHPPKEGKGSRGAGAISGSADYTMEITRQATSAVRELDLTKARDAPQRRLGSFTLVPVVVGIDSREREVKSLRVTMGAPRVERAYNADDVAVMAECIEHAILEEVDVEEFEGKLCVSEMTAFKMYDERRPSKAGTAANKKRWGDAVSFGENSGIIEALPVNGTRYLARREL